MSIVHGLSSLQSPSLTQAQPEIGVPMHEPAWHTSPLVHELPSLQAELLLVWTQPLDGLHESSVHGLASLQLGAGPPTQLPPEQASLVVQALPSLQGAVLLLWMQPVA